MLSQMTRPLVSGVWEDETGCRGLTASPAPSADLEPHHVNLAKKSRLANRLLSHCHLLFSSPVFLPA